MREKDALNKYEWSSRGQSLCGSGETWSHISKYLSDIAVIHPNYLSEMQTTVIHDMILM